MHQGNSVISDVSNTDYLNTIRYIANTSRKIIIFPRPQLTNRLLMQAIQYFVQCGNQLQARRNVVDQAIGSTQVNSRLSIVQQVVMVEDTCLPMEPMNSGPNVVSTLINAVAYVGRLGGVMVFANIVVMQDIGYTKYHQKVDLFGSICI